jgi:hypothetical protein
MSLEVMGIVIKFDGGKYWVIGSREWDVTKILYTCI